jgi:hypothetical protein
MPIVLSGRSQPEMRLSKATLGAKEAKCKSSWGWAQGPTTDNRFERNAPWRSRLASKAQLNMLYKLKGVDAPGDASDQKDVSIMGRKVPISKITAGMIDSYMTATNRGAFVSDAGATIADYRPRRRLSCRRRRAGKREGWPRRRRRIGGICHCRRRSEWARGEGVNARLVRHDRS